MFLIISLILGLIVSVLSKGNFFRLSTLRGLWLAVIPLALNPIMKLYPEIAILPKAVITTISYLFIVLFIIANRRYVASAVFLGLGTISNYIVIAANSFRMPVSVKALEVYSGMTAQSVLEKRPDYFIAENGARFLFMGDVMYIPIPMVGGFMSIGDILLAIGVFLLIVAVTTDKNALAYTEHTAHSDRTDDKHPS